MILNATSTAATVPTVQIGASGMKALVLFRVEIATYLRELPRLLDEGWSGKHAIIHGNDVVSIWDTQNDAIQAAREKFGPDAPIFVKSIEGRDSERFGWLKTQLGESCPF
jgi:hypothetical protein